MFDVLDKLYNLLQRKSVALSDDEIIARPRFNQKAMEAMGTYLGVSGEEIPNLIDQLAARLGNEEEVVSEDDGGEVRYTWEDDALGNVTVRDGVSGKEKYLNVKDAGNLLAQIDNSAEPEQSILAKVFVESVMEADDVEDKELSAAEMSMSASTFNFPWKVGSEHGFGTARFNGMGRSFKVTVINILDKNGDEIHPAAHLKTAIDEIAYNYVQEA